MNTNLNKINKQSIKALLVLVIMKLGGGEARRLFEKTVKETEPKGLRADKWYVKMAKKEYHDEGTIEIDDNALVSRNIEEQAKEKDPTMRGAYVQAWVWIPDK